MSENMSGFTLLTVHKLKHKPTGSILASKNLLEKSLSLSSITGKYIFLSQLSCCYFKYIVISISFTRMPLTTSGEFSFLPFIYVVLEKSLIIEF